MATIITKFSSTASAVPTASDLVQGELAVNTADKRLFTEDSGASIIELGTNPSSLTTGNIVGSGTLAITGASTLTGNVTASNDLSIGGNLTVTGNATISGNLTFGDADTDSISLNADIDSHILPNTDDTYDLGSTSKQWRDLYIDGTANIDSLVADTADINGGTIDGAIIGGSSAAAITGTTGQFNTSLNVDGTITSNGLTVDTDTLHVDAANNLVGIGTTTPVDYSVSARQLVVNGPANCGITIATDNAAAYTSLFFADPNSTSVGRIEYRHNGDDMRFYTSSTEAMNIDSSGNVGIGTTSPSTKLDVSGTVTADGLTVDNNSSTPVVINRNQAIDGYAITMNQADTTDGNSLSISYTTTTTGTVTPDTIFSSIEFEAQTHDWSTRKGNIKLKTTEGGVGHKDRILIAYNGDISFYEDTGTTAKFFWDASTERLGIGNSSPATALDVTGTVTADGLTVDGGANLLTRTSSGAEIDVLEVRNNATAASTASAIKFVNSTAAGSNSGSTELIGIRTGTNTGDFKIRTSNSSAAMTDRVLIDSNGDISFYEDTGTTPKFFWDASAEALGIGTSSPNYPLVIGDGTDSTEYISIESSTTGTAGILFGDTTPARGGILYDNSNNSMAFRTGANTERLRIDSSGNVGIGTSSPSGLLEAYGAGGVSDFDIAAVRAVRSVSSIPRTASYNLVKYRGSNSAILAGDSIGSLRGLAYVGSTGGEVEAARIEFDTKGPLTDATDGIGGTIKFKTRTSGSSLVEVMRIEQDGNVGIGTNSPSERLHVADTNGSVVAHFSGSSNLSRGLKISIEDGTDNGGDVVYDVASANGTHQFDINGSEAMRIDSSGNLLVGTTAESTWTSTEGAAIRENGTATFTRDNNVPFYVNRLTSDGDIVSFRKDGTTVGSIGSNSGAYLTVGNNTSGLMFLDAGSPHSIRPHNVSTNLPSDDNLDFGASSARFQDIYATNGTIQTSDVNEKQDIESLSEAEQRVAVAAKGLLRKFRWKSAVEEKGDDARIHFGIIAQDLQAAFTAEGLDAGRYAMFIHSTWTDEETGEERSRMGVRYSELLAFIIAAI